MYKRQLKAELRDLMETEEDSVVIYGFRTRKYFVREVMGLKKGDPDSPFL